MRLCVGAASRRVVEEAAKLKVHQIVASRRQVANPTGYIGLSPAALVRLVRELSGGATEVVRDHGGPLQGGFDDDGVEAFEIDVQSGFDGLHIDVCELPRDQQKARLLELCMRYALDVDVEIGGEHEHAAWNTELLKTVLAAGVRPSYVVVGVGTHVWADRQIGQVHDVRGVHNAISYARKYNVRTKVHNMDWIGRRTQHQFDAYNIAPEFGQVEVRAILTMLPPDKATALLTYAYDTGRWQRWFDAHEGTYVDRAECAIRYLLDDLRIVELIDGAWSDERETFVRECIRAAIVNG